MAHLALLLALAVVTGYQVCSGGAAAIARGDVRAGAEGGDGPSDPARPWSQCSAQSLFRALRCWGNSTELGAPARTAILRCCGVRQTGCWDEAFTWDTCCRCIEPYARISAAQRNFTDRFMWHLQGEAAEIVTLKHLTASALLLPRPVRLQPHIAERAREAMNVLFLQHVEDMWRTEVMFASAIDPLSDRGAYDGAALVSELLVIHRQRYERAIKIDDAACVLNAFTLECSAPHSPVMSLFPRVEGPALKGQIMDFLGISTEEDVPCPKRFLAGAALSRWYDCQGHLDGQWRQRLPMWDEEYIEWVDVLGSASSAARRGTGFALAEIGAGEVHVWGVRGAAAFRKLAPAGAPCTLLAVEPETLGDGSKLERHLAANLVPGSYNLTVSRDYMLGMEGLVQQLDRAHGGGGFWDLVDFDIQGAEGEIFQGDVSLLAARARRLHISTHSLDIHMDIMARLQAEEWTVLAHFPPLTMPRLGEAGRFVVMDGHLTAVPPQGAPGWSFVW